MPATTGHNDPRTTNDIPPGTAIARQRPRTTATRFGRRSLRRPSTQNDITTRRTTSAIDPLSQSSERSTFTTAHAVSLSHPQDAVTPLRGAARRRSALRQTVGTSKGGVHTRKYASILFSLRDLAGLQPQITTTTTEGDGPRHCYNELAHQSAMTQRATNCFTTARHPTTCNTTAPQRHRDG